MVKNSTIIESAFNYVILMRNEIGHNLLSYMTALMSFISKRCLSGGVHQDSVLKIFLFISYISAMRTPWRLIE